MSFDSIVMAAVADELNRKLADGRVMAVHQPAPLDVVLTIRMPGANHMLLISADAQSPRIHLTSTKRPNPQKPPSFCMILRKHLKGALFAGAEQMDFDRVLRLHFNAFDGERLTLVVEIMGKHSSIILINAAGRILGTIKPVGRSKSRFREVLPGRQYVPPPSQEKLNPLNISPEELRRILAETPEPEIASRLTKSFTGIGPFAAKELAARCERDAARLPGVFEQFFGAIREGAFSPVLITDDAGQTTGFYAFRSAQHPDANQHERTSISAVADMYFTSALPRDAFDHAKVEFIARLRRELEFSEESLVSIREQIAECEGADRLRQIGELILAQIGDVPPEAESAELADYYDPQGGTITVALDRRLTPAENAEVYFRKYRKAVSGAEALQDRLAETSARLKLLKKTLGAADSIASSEQIEQLTRILQDQGIHIRKQEEPSEKKVSEFEGHRIARAASDGWEILVGQNSEANDYLLTRVARPTDIWVHVKASPSAHVVIRTNGKPDAVPRSVIHAAAELAAKNSDSKHSSLVPVDYTLRKYVRKPKGSPAGKALYQNEKTIFITPG